MRYWAYIDSKVCGPFEKEKLAGLASFSLSSLLCPDAPGGAQATDWKAASAFPEVVAALGPVPAPAPQPRRPVEDSPLMMTMRGTLIDAPILETPAAQPPAAAPAQAPKTAAESPLLMTMRGTLIDAPLIEEPAAKPVSVSSQVTGGAALPPPKVTPASVLPGGEAQLEPLRQKLEQMSAMLVSIANGQAQLLDRMGRVESAVGDMKSLLFPSLPKK